MEKILQDFGVNPLLLAAQIVNFLVLLFILNKLLYKPLLKVLNDRKEKIAQSLKDAEQIEATLAKTEEEKEKILLKATDEAKKIVGEATISANQIIEEAHTRAQADITEIIAKAHEQIKLDREKMNQEFRGEVAEIVVAALRQVTGKVLDKKDQKQLIERTVKGL